MSNKYIPSSSPDELAPPKILPDQEYALDLHFSRNKTVHPSDVAILAAETGLSEEQVQKWFLYRLASWRKEQGLGPLVGRLYE